MAERGWHSQLELLLTLHLEPRSAGPELEKVLGLLSLRWMVQSSMSCPILSSALFHLEQSCTSPESRYHQGPRVLQPQQLHIKQEGDL